MSSYLCRICLDQTSLLLPVSDVKMNEVTDGKLLEIFEKLASSKLNGEDGMPTTVCYICVSQLRRCRRLFDMVTESTRTLTELLHNGVEISKNNVEALNLNVTHHLEVANLPHMTVSIPDNVTAEANEEVVRKYETSDKDLEDIEESRLINIDYNSSILETVKQEPLDLEEVTADNGEQMIDIEVDVNINENTMSFVNIKQERVVVKDEATDEGDQIGVEEILHNDENSTNLEVKQEKISKNNVAALNLNVTPHLEVATLPHEMSHDNSIPDNVTAEARDKMVVMKYETTDEDLLDIEESRLINIDYNSSILETVKQEPLDLEEVTADNEDDTCVNINENTMNFVKAKQERVVYYEILSNDEKSTTLVGVKHKKPTDHDPSREFHPPGNNEWIPNSEPLDPVQFEKWRAERKRAAAATYMREYRARKKRQLDATNDDVTVKTRQIAETPKATEANPSDLGVVASEDEARAKSYLDSYHASQKVEALMTSDCIETSDIEQQTNTGAVHKLIATTSTASLEALQHRRAISAKNSRDYRARKRSAIDTPTVQVEPNKTNNHIGNTVINYPPGNIQSHKTLPLVKATSVLIPNIKQLDPVQVERERIKRKRAATAKYMREYRARKYR